MFGFDDDRLERVRTRPSTARQLARALTVLGSLVLVALAGAAGGAWWVLTTPEGMQRAIDWLSEGQPVRITVADVTVQPDSHLLDPNSWRIAVDGIRFDPDDALAVSFTVERVVIGLPDLQRLYAARDLHFPRLDLLGLRIHVKRQRPSPPWQPTTPRLRVVSADEVRVWDASYRADPDDPLGEASVTGLEGTLRAVRYQIGTRELDGEATLVADTFRTGSLLLHRPRCTMHAERSDLTLGDGAFSFAGGTATAAGTIRAIHRKPEVTLEVTLTDADVAEVVHTTTGTKSRVLGTGSLALTIHSGGDLPRGDAWMEGRASVRGGRVQLAATVKDVTRDLIRLAPFLGLDDDDRVVLDSMDGHLRLDRGSVDIRELLYRAPKQTIQVRGRIDETGMALMLRLLPRNDPDTRPSVGLVLHEHDRRFHARLATRDELLGHTPIAPGHLDDDDAAEAHSPIPALKSLPALLKGIRVKNPFKRASDPPARGSTP